VLTKSSAARALVSVQVVSGRDGTRLCLLEPDVGIEYHHPTPTKAISMTLPLNALADCEGNGKGTVQLKTLTNGHVEVRWEHAAIPQVRNYPKRESPTRSFPNWPQRDSTNAPPLLKALEEAMLIPCANSGRLALNCIQLRGDKGDVVATDGRQLLIQGGFQFSWKEPLLVPRSPVFAARELPHAEEVRVAKSQTDVLFRFGSWTIALRIDAAARFPNVDTVVPKRDHAATSLHIPDDEVPTLMKALDNLPGAKEDTAPVTLDLAKRAVVRARAEKEERCTEVVLANSSIQGKPMRISVNRRFVQQALKAGFRTFQITAPDKPVLCQEKERLYVCMPLHPESVLLPQARATRAPLSTVPMKNDSRMAAAQRPKFQAADSAPEVVPANSLGMFDGFLNCARDLWTLVRKHHREERVK
jgi:hypothetical protein